MHLSRSKFSDLHLYANYIVLGAGQLEQEIEEAILFKHKSGDLIQEKIPAGRVLGDVAEKVTNITEDATSLPDEGKKPQRRFIY